MYGLFVKKHAIAVAKKCDVAVLYIQAYNNKTIPFEVIKEFDLTQIIIYYKNFNKNIPLISLFIKAYRFFIAYKKGFKLLKKHFGDYDLIHVNILTRTGVVAWLKKIFSGKPYIITEHWSRYLPITNTYKGFIRKWITKIVVKNASSVTTVTNNLKEAMLSHNLYNTNYQIVPNVISSDFFSHKIQHEKNIKTIIHVSCFEDKSKNISGMLRALKNVSLNRNDFKCIMIGDGIDKISLEKYADSLNILNKTVFFEGLKEDSQLLDCYASADFMLMFSNYENMPVVIPEAFAFGIPVVSTNVGGIPEIVNKTNGILLNTKDEEALENAINFMLDNYQNYDKSMLKKQAFDNFSEEVVGSKFVKIYNEVFKK